jgi:SM-20-related protein
MRKETASDNRSQLWLESCGRNLARNNSRMQSAAVIPKFVLLEEFLFPDELAGLLEYALCREAEFRSATVVTPDDAYATLPEHRRSHSLYDTGPYYQLFDDRIRFYLDSVLDELEHPPFAITRLDAGISANNHEDFFGPHRDNSDPPCRSREISYVYYFHREPKAFSGGELRIYEENSWEHDVIVPAQNRMVFFRSWAIHEVSPVHCPSRDFADSRFAMNGWIHCERNPEPGASR